MKNIYEGSGYKSYIAVPAILFLLFVGAILAWPGLQMGIDLKGGTLLIVRADTAFDGATLQQALQNQFNLTELQVTTISGPTGYGATIQFAHNPEIDSIESLAAQARVSLRDNPATAEQLARQAVEAAQSIAGPMEGAPVSPEDWVDAATNQAIRADEVTSQKLQTVILSFLGENENVRFQKREIGATLGQTFWDSAVTVGLTALFLIVLVVFVFFREVVPSLAIILAGAFDILGATALMAVFGIPLSLNTMPALLMLIGYSVDTDVMLTTKMLKRREGTPGERALDSMKTGLTMTGTSLAALTAMLAISYLGQITVIFEIAAVLLFGLLADILSTWLMNAPVLLWYLERREARA